MDISIKPICKRTLALYLIFSHHCISYFQSSLSKNQSSKLTANLSLQHKNAMKYWQCHYPSIHVIYRVKVFKNHRSHHKEICFLVKKISWLLKVIDLARIKDNIVPLQNCTFFIRKISWNGYEKLWKYSIESFIPCPLSKNLRQKCVLPKLIFTNNMIILMVAKIVINVGQISKVWCN